MTGKCYWTEGVFFFFFSLSPASVSSCLDSHSRTDRLNPITGARKEKRKKARSNGSRGWEAEGDTSTCLIKSVCVLSIRKVWAKKKKRREKEKYRNCGNPAAIAKWPQYRVDAKKEQERQDTNSVTTETRDPSEHQEPSRQSKPEATGGGGF